MGRSCKWTEGDSHCHWTANRAHREGQQRFFADYLLARRDKFANDTRRVTSDSEQVTQKHRRDERKTP
jgi:hypothetical protein